MDWIRRAKIGHGSFGFVNLAIPIPTYQNCPKLMALKSCRVPHSASLMNEKLILDDLNGCPYIISCLGDCFSFENGEKLYNVLLEYASGGTLCDKIKNSDNHKLPEFEVRGYTKSILGGLEFIHKKGYVHCDIKTQNILLGQNGEVLIADFGFAKRSGLKEMSESRCELRGTPMHMSPEMVTGGEVECPADIWALGCVVVEMLTGSPPWSCSDMGSLLMKIGFGDEMPQLPTKLSVEGKDFLGKCFVKHPRNRWTAEMLLNHPFLENINGTDHDTVTLQESCNFPSTSPRCPFDFPEWLSENSSFTTSTTASPTATSAAERLKGLECNRWLDWSGGDDWVNVR